MVVIDTEVRVNSSYGFFQSFGIAFISWIQWNYRHSGRSDSFFILSYDLIFSERSKQLLYII